MSSQPNAQLQHRLLLRLARPEPVNSVAELGREIDASRPSASRALHALKQAGLVAQHEGRWTLTQAGRDYAGVLRDGVLGRVNKLADETRRGADGIVNHRPGRVSSPVAAARAAC